MGRVKNKTKAFLTVQYREYILERIGKEGEWSEEQIAEEIKKRVKDYKDVGIDKKDFDKFCNSENRHLARVLGFTRQTDYSLQKNHLLVLGKVFPAKSSKMICKRFHILPNLKPISHMSNPKVLKDEKAKPLQNSYRNIVDSALQSRNKASMYEDAIIVLINAFNNPANKSATIVSSELSFVYKLAPTIAAFLYRKAQVCVLFDPRHAYSLLTGKEFAMLYKLGIPIKVLDFKDGFRNHGIFFNYNALSSQPQNLSSVLFYEFKSRLFDHKPFLNLIDGASNIHLRELQEIIEETNNKANKAVLISHQHNKQNGVEIIANDKYENWLLSKFKEYRIKEGSKVPIYTKVIHDLQDTNLKQICFKFVDIPIRDIYYRNTRVIAYKVFQAESLIDSQSNLFCTIENGLAVFKPISLFQTAKGDFFPINVPFVEFNPLCNRYELAEGHSRIYALCNRKDVVKVRVLAVENLPNYCFEINPIFENIDNPIKNKWDMLPVKREYSNEQNILIYRRDIESITHHFSNSIYSELGSTLIDNKILTAEEVKYFSKGEFNSQS